jgi:hypothetical protein
VYTDDEFARRFSTRPSDVAARTFSKDIAYTMLEALVDKGFTVAFNQEDEFGWLATSAAEAVASREASKQRSPAGDETFDLVRGNALRRRERGLRRSEAPAKPSEAKCGPEEPMAY